MRAWLALGLLACAVADGERSARAAAEAEARERAARGVCCICQDDPCEVVFTGCGHMNMCLRCSQRLVEHASLPPSQAVPCPLCRTRSQPVLVRVS